MAESLAEVRTQCAQFLECPRGASTDALVSGSARQRKEFPDECRMPVLGNAMPLQQCAHGVRAARHRGVVLGGLLSGHELFQFVSFAVQDKSGSVVLQNKTTLKMSCRTVLLAWCALKFNQKDEAMVDIPVLLEHCAPQVAPSLMRALVHIESGWQPFAIGMDAGQGSVPQPRSVEQAVVTASQLVDAGRSFSVGLAQVHVSNVLRSGLSWERAFDPCTNLGLGQSILAGFYRAAGRAGYAGDGAVRAALRGYNSGGIDRFASEGYAANVIRHAATSGKAALLRADTAVYELVPSAPTDALGRRTSSDKAAGFGATDRRPQQASEIFEKATSVPGF